MKKVFNYPNYPLFIKKHVNLKYFKFIILLMFLNSLLLLASSFSISLSDTNREVSALSESYFIDVSVADSQYIITHYNLQSKNTFQLFSHGKSGELLIAGRWKNAYKLANWLARIMPKGTRHLNIYGCEFAKGEKGRAAIRYLENSLNISIAASDDVTGKDGDWELEIGQPIAPIEVPDYEGNLQTCDCTDYIYLNDTSLDYVEKFKVTDAGLVEIGDAQNGQPWLNADGIVDGPHGIAGDANGFLYIGQRDNGNNIQKFTCDGTKVDTDLSTPAIDNVIDGYFGFNHFIQDGILYVPGETFPNTGGENYPNGRLIAIDVCTGEELGCLWDAYFWGFTYNEFDGQWYGTTFETNIKTGNLYDASWGATGGECGGFGNGVTNVVNIDTLAANNPVISLAGYTDARPQGIVFDDMGNMYVVVSDGFGYAPPSSILKWERTTGIWSQSATDFSTENTVGDNLNWAGARGITYSQSSGLLYLSTLDDCVAAFNTDLVYQPNQSVHIKGEFPKGIGVVTECCPLAATTVIDTTICTAATADTLYLQDILACDGIVCEGTWSADVSNAGLEYDACDNTIIIVDADNGCGTFTLSSQGGGLAQCGAFTMTMNICVQFVNPPEISVTDNDCDANTPGNFALVMPCETGNIAQWSTDGGITWSNTVPTYSTANPMTVISRCVDSADNTCASVESLPVTSNPADCPCPTPNCFGIRIQQN